MVMSERYEHKPPVVRVHRYLGTSKLLGLFYALCLHKHGKWSAKRTEKHYGVVVHLFLLVVVHSTCLFNAATVTGTMGSIRSSMAWA